MRRIMWLLVAVVSFGFITNASAGLRDAVFVNSFVISDNGQVNSQDALTFDGTNIWAVSHTDDQHHYLSKLTTNGAMLTQFPTNCVFYSGMVTGLAYRPNVGVLAKNRKRIYTLGSNGTPIAELGSSLSHNTIAFNSTNNTVISLMAMSNGTMQFVFTDIDSKPHIEWKNQYYYYNPAAVVVTGVTSIGDAEYSNGYLYVGIGSAVLKIDVSNFASPMIVDTLPMPFGKSAFGIAVNNDMLYVGVRNSLTGNMNTVEIYNMNPPLVVADKTNNGVRDHGQGEGRNGVGQGKAQGNGPTGKIAVTQTSWGDLKQGSR